MHHACDIVTLHRLPILVAEGISSLENRLRRTKQPGPAREHVLILSLLGLQFILLLFNLKILHSIHL